MDIKNKNHGTSDMPSPKVMDYNSQYKLTPLFLSDLKIVLKNILIRKILALRVTLCGKTFHYEDL